MRRKRGTTAKVTVLSSRKSFSDRMRRPATRRKMIVAQKRVIHQQTRSVGLSSSEECNGGGDEYNDMVTAVNGGHARQPPQRDERGVRSRPQSSQTRERLLLRLMGEDQLATTCRNIQLPKAGGWRIQPTRCWESVFPRFRYPGRIENTLGR